jgi:hypothetical protein
MSVDVHRLLEEGARTLGYRPDGSYDRSRPDGARRLSRHAGTHPPWSCSARARAGAGSARSEMWSGSRKSGSPTSSSADAPSPGRYKPACHADPATRLVRRPRAERPVDKRSAIDAGGLHHTRRENNPPAPPCPQREGAATPRSSTRRRRRDGSLSPTAREVTRSDRGEANRSDHL